MNSISFIYKGCQIIFDEINEEWVCYLDDGDENMERFKSNKSLKLLKDSIDRFVAKTFDPIPVIYFNNAFEMVGGEIVSFTNNCGECWVKRVDGRRELVRTIKTGPGAVSRKIYACGNYMNEPKFLEIFRVDGEIIQLQKKQEELNKERHFLIDSLEPYDITGFYEISTK